MLFPRLIPAFMLGLALSLPAAAQPSQQQIIMGWVENVFIEAIGNDGRRYIRSLYTGWKLNDC